MPLGPLRPVPTGAPDLLGSSWCRSKERTSGAPPGTQCPPLLPGPQLPVISHCGHSESRARSLQGPPCRCPPGTSSVTVTCPTAHRPWYPPTPGTSIQMTGQGPIWLARWQPALTASDGHSARGLTSVCLCLAPVAAGHLDNGCHGRESLVGHMGHPRPTGKPDLYPQQLPPSKH